MANNNSEDFGIRLVADIKQFKSGIQQAMNLIDNTAVKTSALDKNIKSAMKINSAPIKSMGTTLKSTVSEYDRLVKAYSKSSAELERMNQRIDAQCLKILKQNDVYVDQKARLNELLETHKNMAAAMQLIPKSAEKMGFIGYYDSILKQLDDAKNIKEQVSKFLSDRGYKDPKAELFNQSSNSRLFNYTDKSGNSKLINADQAREAFTSIDRLEKKLNALDAAYEKLSDADVAKYGTVKGFNQLGKEIERTQAKMQAAKSHVQELCDPLSQLRAEAQTTANAATNTANAANTLGQNIQNTSAHVGDAVSKYNNFHNAMKMIDTQAKNIKKGFKNISKTIDNATKAFKKFCSTNPQAKAVDKTVKKLTKSLFSLATMLKMRLKRQIITNIYNGLKDGLKSIVKESESTNAAMSKFVASWHRFANQLAAAVQPILEHLLPVFAVMMDRISAVMEKVSQFTAALSGNNTYKKAKLETIDYAKSLDNATKSQEKLTKSVMGFDQLNKISGDSKEAVSGKKFIDALVDEDAKNKANEFKAIMNDIKNSLKDGDLNAAMQGMLDAFNLGFSWISNVTGWENAGAAVQDILNKISGTINKFINNTNWGDMGATIGSGINSIVEYFNNFLNDIDFSGLGLAISDHLNGITSVIDGQQIGESIGGIFSSIVDTLESFTGNLNWAGIGKNLSDGFSGIVSKIDGTKIGKLFTNTVNGIFKTLSTLLADQTSWGKLGTEIGNAFNSIITNFDPSNIFKSISNLIIDLMTMITEFIRTIDATELVNALINVVKSIITDVDWVGIIIKAIEMVGIYNNLLANIATAIIEKILELPGKIKSFVESSGESIGRNFAESITKTIKAMIDSFIATFNPFGKLAQKISGKIAQYTINSELPEGHKIKYYADGGFPSVGQMFLARESGPEMVGTINGNTAVANNSQIVEAVSSGVSKAVTEVLMAFSGNDKNDDKEIIMECDGEAIGRVIVNSQALQNKRINPLVIE